LGSCLGYFPSTRPICSGSQQPPSRSLPFALPPTRVVLSISAPRSLHGAEPLRKGGQNPGTETSQRRFASEQCSRRSLLAGPALLAAVPWLTPPGSAAAASGSAGSFATFPGGLKLLSLKGGTGGFPRQAVQSSRLPLCVCGGPGFFQLQLPQERD